jgi:hypothetical protein
MRLAFELNARSNGARGVRQGNGALDLERTVAVPGVRLRAGGRKQHRCGRNGSRKEETPEVHQSKHCGRLATRAPGKAAHASREKAHAARRSRGAGGRSDLDRIFRLSVSHPAGFRLDLDQGTHRRGPADCPAGGRERRQNNA